MVGIAGSTVAWADELPPPCPASPNYSPDFSSNQNCVTLNNNAAFGVPAYSLPPVAGSVNPPAPPPSGVTTVLRLTPNSTFQSGSAWFNSPQPVAGAFSTTFSFQLSGANTYACGGDQPPCPADGIAFVIQNSPAETGAIDTGGASDGCGLGFGEAVNGTCTPSTGGITNSVAVAFDTYQNTDINDVSNNHVEIQSCGQGANTVDSTCRLGDKDLTALTNPINMADGQVHTVTITYTPGTASGCGEGGSAPCPPNLDVILDGTDLFPGGVVFDMTTIGLGTGNTAWVGLTGATGGGVDNHDILSWTLTPGSQSGTATAGTTLDLNFGGGLANNGYDASTLLASGSFTVQVNPIVQLLNDPPTCNQLVNLSFPGAECFVYDNADGMGDPGTVMFEYTCPGSDTGGTCGAVSNADFIATLGTDFYFSQPHNPDFYTHSTLPLVGWLKGSGPNPLEPCTPGYDVNNNPLPLFLSNQIISFTDPPTSPTQGSGKGGSQGTGSCWTLTYLTTPTEAPSVTITSPVNGGTYQQGQATAANYTCNAVNAGVLSPTGPYLTVASCGATDSPGGSVNNGAQFDTATLGSHTFIATVVDSALDTVSQTYNYNVVGATDVAIANLAASSAATGSQLTYVIGVGDLGNATAVNVMVNDALDPGTSFVSASGSNVACGLVNKKVSCQTIPFPCVSAGPSGPVSCTVGPIYPLSISSLNGAVIKVVVKVNAPAGTKANPAVLKNTATVSAANLDPKLSNNSSTASTTVTAH